MKKSLAIIIAATVILTLTAFVKKDKPLKLLPKGIQKTYAHIPSGTFLLRSENSHGDEATSTAVHTEVDEFYMFKTEVSNMNYREFLSYLRVNGETEKLKIAEIDSTIWTTSFSYGEPFTDLYAWHPAYNDYPVVNVSHEGALLFCEFLEDVLNQESEINYKVSLPTRAEWTYAAEAMKKFPVYPWGGLYLENAKGCALANFRMIGAESVSINPETEELEVIPQPRFGKSDATVTAPVASYTENEWGLMNMSGNVAEMVLEQGIACGGGWNSTGFDVRCNSTMRYKTPQTDIGFRPIIRIVK